MGCVEFIKNVENLNFNFLFQNIWNVTGWLLIFESWVCWNWKLLVLFEISNIMWNCFWCVKEGPVIFHYILNQLLRRSSSQIFEQGIQKWLVLWLVHYKFYFLEKQPKTVCYLFFLNDSNSIVNNKTSNKKIEFFWSIMITKTIDENIWDFSCILFQWRNRSLMQFKLNDPRYKKCISECIYYTLLKCLFFFFQMIGMKRTSRCEWDEILMRFDNENENDKKISSI